MAMLKTQSSTHAPGLSTPSCLSRIVAQLPLSLPCCPRLSLLYPSIHGLPRTRPALTSTINTLLTIRYSSILSTCPNHLNTLWSALLANSLSIKALLCTSSFLTLSFHDSPIKLPKHFISRTSTFLLATLLIPMPLLRTAPSVQLLLHIDTSHLSQILYCPGQNSVCHNCEIYSCADGRRLTLLTGSVVGDAAQACVSEEDDYSTHGTLNRHALHSTSRVHSICTVRTSCICATGTVHPICMVHTQLT